MFRPPTENKPVYPDWTPMEWEKLVDPVRKSNNLQEIKKL